MFAQRLRVPGYQNYIVGVAEKVQEGAPSAGLWVASVLCPAPRIAILGSQLTMPNTWVRSIKHARRLSDKTVVRENGISSAAVAAAVLVVTYPVETC